jgi:hypothetical protein
MVEGSATGPDPRFANGHVSKSDRLPVLYEPNRFQISLDVPPRHANRKAKRTLILICSSMLVLIGCFALN